MPDPVLAELGGDLVELQAAAEHGRVRISWGDCHDADGLNLSRAEARRLMYQLARAHTDAAAPEEALSC